MVCPLKDGLNSKLVIRSRLMRKLRRRGSFEMSRLASSQHSRLRREMGEYASPPVRYLYTQENMVCA